MLQNLKVCCFLLDIKSVRTVLCHIHSFSDDSGLSFLRQLQFVDEYM